MKNNSSSKFKYVFKLSKNPNQTLRMVPALAAGQLSHKTEKPKF